MWEFLEKRRFLRKSKTPRRSPEKWTFLSLAFYNAPSLHIVNSNRLTLGKICSRVAQDMGRWGLGRDRRRNGWHVCRTKMSPKQVSSILKMVRTRQEGIRKTTEMSPKHFKPLSCCLKILTGTSPNISHFPNFAPIKFTATICRGGHVNPLATYL